MILSNAFSPPVSNSSGMSNRRAGASSFSRNFALASWTSGTVAGGVLDRDRLSRLVLGYPSELEALEAIVHPEVQEARAKFLKENEDAPALLFDIPLLFETGGEKAFDKVIVVSAPDTFSGSACSPDPG